MASTIAKGRSNGSDTATKNKAAEECRLRVAEAVDRTVHCIGSGDHRCGSVQVLAGIGAVTAAALKAVGITEVCHLAALSDTASQQALVAAIGKPRLVHRWIAAAQLLCQHCNSDAPADSLSAGESKQLEAAEDKQEEDEDKEDKEEEEELLASFAALSVGSKTGGKTTEPSGYQQLAAMRSYLTRSCSQDATLHSVLQQWSCSGSNNSSKPSHMATSKSSSSNNNSSKSTSSNTSSRRRRASFSQLLAENGVTEIENLNGVAPAGSCQFASVGEQLFQQQCTETLRYDQALRQAACDEIVRCQDVFKPFLLAAHCRTRRQQSVAGDGVDFAAYIKRMREDSCDGDHITLQALSNVTGATIRVLKWDEWAKTATLLPDVVPMPGCVGGAGKLKLALDASKRVLWLSLRGEAHYRSLRPSSGK